MGGDGLFIEREQLAILHQHFAGNDCGGDHAFMEAEEDMPGEISRGERGVWVVVDED